jgi:hypothetical protein
MNYADSILAFYGVLPAWLKWLRDPALLVAVSLGLASLGLVSVLVLPFLLVRIPTDYFVAVPAPTRRGSASWFERVIKNLLGGLMLVLGVIMLVLPGQGVLTIVAALVLLDFPGKRRLERRLLLRPRVLGVLNSLRARAGRPPLELDQTRSFTTVSSRSRLTLRFPSRHGRQQPCDGMPHASSKQIFRQHLANHCFRYHRDR